MVGFVNLERTGPLIIDFPAGPMAGGVLDFWQRPATDLGLTGPDAGQGGRYLCVGPGQEVPDLGGVRAVQVPTVNIFHATRILATDPAQAAALLAGYRVYPASKADSPPPTRVISPDGREWSGTHPRGLDYWAMLSRLVNEEPVHERDRIMLAMLERLGIVKGQPFTPDKRQTRILEEAAVVGEAMARANGYLPRFDGARIWPGTDWKIALFLDASQESQYTTQLDERAAWFYEAVTATKGMTTTTPGQGQVYLHVGKDANGHWLIGDRSYELTVPANAPVAQFWSFTVYDADTRCFADNPHDIAGRSSRDDLLINTDGSVTLFFGPAAPDKGKQNWVPTVPRRGWFGYFRFYAPLEPYFDRTWQLPDIQRTE